MSTSSPHFSSGGKYGKPTDDLPSMVLALQAKVDKLEKQLTQSQGITFLSPNGQATSVLNNDNDGNLNWNGAVLGGYAETIGDGVTTNFEIMHNLNTQDVVVSVYESASPYSEISPEYVQHSSVDAVSIIFSVAPSIGQYRVCVLAAV